MGCARPVKALLTLKDLSKVFWLWKRCKKSSAYRRPEKDLQNVEDSWRVFLLSKKIEKGLQAIVNPK